MLRKIVRDLEKKRPVPVFLNMQHHSSEKSLSKEALSADCINLSHIEEETFILTQRTGSMMRDITKISQQENVFERKKNDVFFFHIGSERKFRPDPVGEVTRLLAAGILILTFIHSLNILKQGYMLKDTVMASAISGYEELLAAGNEVQKSNFLAAETTFKDATRSFNSALQSIAFLQNKANPLLKEKTVDSAHGLLEAAKNLASAGKDFSRGIENLQQLPTLFLRENNQIILGSHQTQPKSLTEKLKEDITFLKKAGHEVQMAQKNLERVDASILPFPLNENFKFLKGKIHTIADILADTEQKIPALLELLGDRYPHRYLVLLQNDTEARPTGGFIGSYMIIDVNDGYITKTEFHDVYESDGQLKEKISPPEDIAPVSNNWGLRDSNYSPDFSVSAEKAAWFLQKTGPSIDTVIAFNQSFLADLLEATGAIDVHGLQASVSKENYQIVLSYIIESKLSGVQEPKKILSEFIEGFKAKVFSSNNWEKVLLTFIKGYQQKKLLFYSRNEKVQAMFQDLKMTGQVLATQPEEDYLNVTAVSVGGNKSDAFIQQNIQHITLVQEDGMLINEVTISRRHNWTGKDLEQWHKTLKDFGFETISEVVKDILGRGENKALMKIYVPQGTTLLKASGVKNDKEFILEKEQILLREDQEIKKTYFLLPMNVRPAEETSVTLKYRLPRPLQFLPADSYKFFVQIQPGQKPSFFRKTVVFEKNLKSYKEFPQTFSKDQNGTLSFHGNLGQDMFLSALIGL